MQHPFEGIMPFRQEGRERRPTRRSALRRMAAAAAALLGMGTAASAHGPRRRPTTLALGEEGGVVTTQALGEEGGRVTTYALGEEGGPVTTYALGEEGGPWWREPAPDSDEVPWQRPPLPPLPPLPRVPRIVRPGG